VSTENQESVHASDISQERVDETAKRKHEPVAWHEPGAYGNVTTYKDWALANGWLPLYAAPREWLVQPDLAMVGEVGVWGEEKNT
jgi:hypothetical protein